MGTASTMNSLAEALGMSLPGCAAIPAPYRDRARMAYRPGVRIVEMVREDLKPSDILTREDFNNAIVVNSAIGGSTNAPIHIDAIARHIGVDLPLDGLAAARATTCRCWSTCSRPGEYLGEEFYHAGGVPAVVHELMRTGLIRENAPARSTARPSARTAAIRRSEDRDVIRTFDTRR